MTAVLVIVCVLRSWPRRSTGSAPRTPKRARRGVWPARVRRARGCIGFLDATYLAGPFHFGRHGGAAPVLVVRRGGDGAAHRARVPRWRRGDARCSRCSSALGTIVVLHVVDLVTGAHLEWNTVFGYSPTIGIRFVGEGNMTFSQLTAAAVLFAGLLVWQVPTRAGVRVAVAVLAVTVVVMGVPFWGNDFGGASPPLPGFALLGVAAARARAAVAHGAGCSSACSWPPGWSSALLDLLRPPDQRTHVGKFFQKAGTDFDGATLVLRRKAAENLSVLGHSVLLGC